MCYPERIWGIFEEIFQTFNEFKTKATIGKAHSGIQIRDSKPLFLFVLDYTAHSPEEFFLVKLRPNDSTRQIFYEKPTNGTGPIVINDSLKMDFNIRKVEVGFYEVSPCHFLLPGEYGFIYNSTAFYSGNRYRIYDFSII